MPTTQPTTKPDAKCRECGETFPAPALAKCPECGGRYLSTPADLAREDRIAVLENAVAALRAEADRLQAVADAMHREGVLKMERVS